MEDHAILALYFARDERAPGRDRRKNTGDGCYAVSLSNSPQPPGRGGVRVRHLHPGVERHPAEKTHFFGGISHENCPQSLPKRLPGRQGKETGRRPGGSPQPGACRLRHRKSRAICGGGGIKPPARPLFKRAQPQGAVYFPAAVLVCRRHFRHCRPAIISPRAR